MGQVINTNTLSLLTQNNLSKSQAALNTSIQRLSSGVRINSAKDDAAGQAIANRFSANIRGLTQAQRNANDGISLAQTTEGALNEINTNLQRVRELTVQASNGSNSDSDLVSIQSEIDQRLAEIDRTSQQTDFNGVKVLSSVATGLSIQVGSDDNQVVSINLQEISKSKLDLTGFQVQKASTMVSASKANVGAVTTGVAVMTDSFGTPVAATGLYALKDGSGYAVKTATGYEATTSISAAGAVAFDSSVADVAANLVDASTNLSGTAIKQTVTLDAPPAGTTYWAVTTGGVANGTYVAKTAPGGVETFNEISIATDGSGDVTVGNQLTMTTSSPTANALKTLDKALAKVDAIRGALGAVQNRFDSIISNLGTTINNLTSSKSRIEDADYATEVSNMTRAQILQQAGTSVLAKANQSTQGVMALLQ